MDLCCLHTHLQRFSKVNKTNRFLSQNKFTPHEKYSEEELEIGKNVDENSPTVTGIIYRLSFTRAWESVKSRQLTILAISLKFNPWQIFLLYGRFHHHRNTDSYTKGCLLFIANIQSGTPLGEMVLFMEYRSAVDTKKLVGISGCSLCQQQLSILYCNTFPVLILFKPPALLP